MFPKVVLSQTIPYEESQGQYIVGDPSVAKQLYFKWQAEKAKTDYSSCVLFSKRLTGYVGTVGAAKNWPRNVSFPIVGGVVVLNEGKWGHVAVITSVGQDSFTVTEANYVPNQKSTRTLLLNNPQIEGYWMEVN